MPRSPYDTILRNPREYEICSESGEIHRKTFWRICFKKRSISMFHLVIFKTQPALQGGGYHERQIFGNLGSELASCPLKFEEAYRQAWFERREQIVSEKEVDWRRCSADCRAETKTIPSQGSRAPIMQQTFQGLFTALSKSMFASNHFARLKFSKQIQIYTI